MGPWAGWIGGWAIIVADIIVMANLAQIAGIYTFLLFGWDSAANSTGAVTARRRRLDRRHDGDLLIGIELSARTQVVLLSAEILTLALFAVVALVKVSRRHRRPELGRPVLPGSTRSRSVRSAP